MKKSQQLELDLWQSLATASEFPEMANLRSRYVQATDLAYVIYTSGSTLVGLPVGLPTSQHHPIANS